MNRGVQWAVRSTILGFLVVQGVTACGRDRDAVPVTWEASGIQVTRLDLPLAGDLHKFTLRGYVLEGRERSGKPSPRSRLPHRPRWFALNQVCWAFSLPVRPTTPIAISYSRRFGGMRMHLTRSSVRNGASRCCRRDTRI